MADSGRIQARELNIGFISRVTRSRPWVRMKIAASLDGRTALANGHSQWITGEAIRRACSSAGPMAANCCWWLQGTTRCGSLRSSAAASKWW